MKDRAHVLLVRPKEGPDAGLWSIPGELVNDGESVRDCAIRGVKDNLGLDTDPKMTLFICERVQLEDHRIGVFVLSEPVVELGKEPQLSGSYGKYEEAEWVDVRTLGEIQRTQGMSEFAADAFFKFSNFLKSQAPTSGRVN
jgi:ADP-ribose pyrophosphatase YjhB (NUDIX family)